MKLNWEILHLNSETIALIYGFLGVVGFSLTKNFLMVHAPGFIRGINPKSKIENPQAPTFIRGVNLKSKI